MNTAALAIAIDATSGYARSLADAAGRGAEGLLLNAISTQLALLAASARGIGTGAPGVTDKPTDGSK